jgi:hypothetical protein
MGGREGKKEEERRTGEGSQQPADRDEARHGAVRVQGDADRVRAEWAEVLRIRCAKPESQVHGEHDGGRYASVHFSSARHVPTQRKRIK